MRSSGAVGSMIANGSAKRGVTKKGEACSLDLTGA